MHNLALEAAASDSNLPQETVFKLEKQRDTETDIIQLAIRISVIIAVYCVIRRIVTDTWIGRALIVLDDSSGPLGSIPCNTRLFSAVEQRADAPMMSKKSTTDIVVPNCWHTPLHWLSGWVVRGGGGKHSHRKTHSFLKQGCFFPLHVILNP